jgi:glutathione synthase
VRLTLAQIAATCTVDPADATLRLSDGTPVSLVYFRAGYTPNDYPSDTEWEARLLIEGSSAAKCPSVAYQLAGAKKVQQDLAGPGVVERFVGPAAGAQLRQLFAGRRAQGCTRSPEASAW